MKEEVKCPRNCNECIYTHNCVSAFGNTGCKFKDLIISLRKRVKQ